MSEISNDNMFKNIKTINNIKSTLYLLRSLTLFFSFDIECIQLITPVNNG